jgi:ribonuclease-3
MINKIADLKFKNPQLLITALTHRSALNEKKGAPISNERLEFLGDAVLEVIVSNYLYHRFPHRPEGDLTHLRSQVVQTKTLATVARKLKLGSLVFLSKGEKKSGGAQNDSLLADLFEAVIGAIYLDQGLETTTKFIQQHLLSHIKQIKQEAKIVDYKSLLQEKLQARYKTAPVYRISKTSGPDHHKKFTVKVFLKRQAIGQGSGFSKQDAEQKAAQAALEKNSHF